MKRERSKRSKPPSRKRYEEENPTVSARVPKETRDKLRLVLAKLGMSLPNALKVLAGELEVKAKPLEEARQAGYEEAKKLYMVTYACSICGKPIAITSPRSKEAAGSYMKEHGWGHAECHQRKRQS